MPTERDRILLDLSHYYQEAVREMEDQDVTRRLLKDLLWDSPQSVIEDRRGDVVPGLGGEWEYPARHMNASGMPDHGARVFDELYDAPKRSPLYVVRRNPDGTIDYTPSGGEGYYYGRPPSEALHENTMLRYLMSGEPPIIIKKQGRRQD